jgi:hypothetical protein
MSLQDHLGITPATSLNHYDGGTLDLDMAVNGLLQDAGLIGPRAGPG